MSPAETICRGPTDWPIGMASTVRSAEASGASITLWATTVSAATAVTVRATTSAWARSVGAAIEWTGLISMASA